MVGTEVIDRTEGRGEGGRGRGLKHEDMLRPTLPSSLDFPLCIFDFCFVTTGRRDERLPGKGQKKLQNE